MLELHLVFGGGFIMPKILDYSEEVDFLEAEIIEDDETAPVGELVVRVDGSAETQVEATAEPIAEEAPAFDTELANEETFAVEVAEEVAVEESVAVEETPVAVEEAHVEVEEPVKVEVAVESATEETVVEEQKAQFDSFTTSTQSEISGSSFDMPEEPKKKATTKKTAKPKTAEQDVWGTAVINVKKETKAKPVKDEQVIAEETTAEKAPAKAKKTTKAADAPAEKAPTKKTTKKTNKTMTSEEEIIVAKAVEKEATKKAPAQETPVEKAPAKKATAKEEVKETVIVEGEGKTHGKYVIKKTDKGFFVFKLFSSNHRVVAIGSQAYKDLKSCKGGIQSVINNAEKAPIENQTLKSYEVQKCPKWIIYEDKKGEYRLRLIASNGNIVATTNDGYVDVSGAKNGIAAVARASKGCAIVRNDDLW